jgi:hypothetical protein
VDHHETRRLDLGWNSPLGEEFCTPKRDRNHIQATKSGCTGQESTQILSPRCEATGGTGMKSDKLGDVCNAGLGIIGSIILVLCVVLPILHCTGTLRNL